MTEKEQTHFGYETIDSEEKEGRVGAVFDSVAGKYDLMNDVMSAGIHRAWKNWYVWQTGVKPGEAVLDLAAGTGDKDKFVSQLKEKGIDTVLRYTDEGRIYGATFIDHRTGCVLNGSRMGKELSANALQEHFTLPYAGQPPIPLSIPVDAADKAHGQTAYDSEDISGGMGLLTPEGPAVDAEEEAFIRAMKRKKKKKRKGLGL